jgi:hypothetical protein
MATLKQNSSITALTRLLTCSEGEEDLRSFGLDADQVSEGTDQLDGSDEFRTLVQLIRMVRDLYILRNCMEQDKDVMFPGPKKRSYISLCLSAEKEHARLKRSVDTVINLVLFLPMIPLDEFELRMETVAQLFYPLLLDHLDFEEGLARQVNRAS